MKTGIELIATERQEQLKKHGFDVTNDTYYSKNELVKAAMFALNPNAFAWPQGWDRHFEEKIRGKDRVSQLKVAGAFIAAEIDRILQSNQ